MPPQVFEFAFQHNPLQHNLPQLEATLGKVRVRPLPRPRPPEIALDPRALRDSWCPPLAPCWRQG